MNLLYSPEARSTIRRIRCNLPPRQSIPLLAEIREGCRRLTSFPDLGFALDVPNRPAPRALILRNYVVLYEHDDDAVYISAIEPMRSDWAASFYETADDNPSDDAGRQTDER